MASIATQEDLVQHQLIKVLIDAPLGTGIGVACSFLLHCATHHRTEFRRVMHEKVVRNGFRGISLLQMFNRMSQ